MAEKMSRENCPVYMKLIVLPAGPQWPLDSASLHLADGRSPYEKDIDKFTFVQAQRNLSMSFSHCSVLISCFGTLPSSL